MLTALALLLAVAVDAGTPAKPRVAVADALVEGLDGVTSSSITSVVAAQLADPLGWDAVTLADVGRALETAKLRQLAGCETDCADAAALESYTGAPRLLVTTVSALGDEQLVTLVSIEAGRVVRRVARESPGVHALPETVADAVFALVKNEERPSKQPRVAVLPFDDRSKGDELAPLREGLADMLAAELGALPDVKLVERSRLASVLAELELQKSKAFDPASAQQVGKLLGAQFLVLGGFFELMGSMRVDARIVRVETGEVVKTAGASGKKDDFLDVVAKVSSLLAVGLGGKLDVPAEPPKATFDEVMEYARIVQVAGTPDAAQRSSALAKKQPKFKAAARLAKRGGR